MSVKPILYDTATQTYYEPRTAGAKDALGAYISTHERLVVTEEYGPRETSLEPDGLSVALNRGGMLSILAGGIECIFFQQGFLCCFGWSSLLANTFYSDRKCHQLLKEQDQKMMEIQMKDFAGFQEAKNPDLRGRKVIRVPSDYNC